MKSFFNVIENYFGFSRKEAKGFVVVLGLMMLSWFLPFIYKKMEAEAIISDKEMAQNDSLLARIEQTKLATKKSNFGGYNNYQKESYANYSPEHPTAFTDFDPNTASAEQMQSMMPKFLAERIVKYRSKGGKFFKKEDMQRIYGMSPTLYQKLEAHIEIVQNNTKAESVTNISEPKFTENAPPKPFSKPSLALFDINAADTTQLIKLKGIGSKLAIRIVKFRDALGGFHSIEQYKEIFGLDSLAMSELKRFAVVKSSVKKIAINTATPEALDRLPYLSFKQAQIIVRYREQHGAFASSQDLLKIKILDATLIQKITPYLSFD